jgi:hypothetical protein
MTADAYFAMSNYVWGFCAQQTASVGLSNRPGFDVKAYYEMVRQYIEALPSDLYPNLARSARRIFNASMDVRFAFGIDCLIAGLEARLKENSTK